MQFATPEQPLQRRLLALLDDGLKDEEVTAVRPQDGRIVIRQDGREYDLRIATVGAAVASGWWRETDGAGQMGIHTEGQPMRSRGWRFCGDRHPSASAPAGRGRPRGPAGGQEVPVMRPRSDESGFNFIEVLAVVLLLGILALVALPNYFGTQNAVRASNVSAINTAIALFQYRHGGACPGQTGQETFANFLADTTYFPDGVPVDPFTKDDSTFITNYNSRTCRTS